MLKDAVAKLNELREVYLAGVSEVMDDIDHLVNKSHAKDGLTELKESVECSSDCLIATIETYGFCSNGDYDDDIASERRHFFSKASRGC